MPTTKASKKTTKKTVRPAAKSPKKRTRKAATKQAKKTVAEPKKASHNVSAKYFAAVGRRKSAVARVRLYKGTGKITVNEKSLEDFFPGQVWQEKVAAPLVLTGNKKVFDISVRTHGGGVNGQAEASRHGIARALEIFDGTLRPTLKKAGYLTRDSREKERKKYGLKRARRAPQFSKR